MEPKMHTCTDSADSLLGRLLRQDSVVAVSLLKDALENEKADIPS